LRLVQQIVARTMDPLDGVAPDMDFSPRLSPYSNGQRGWDRTTDTKFQTSDVTSTLLTDKVAERGGFEPPAAFRLLSFSKRVVSSTHPPVRMIVTPRRS
jgi:hypothetical protein